MAGHVHILVGNCPMTGRYREHCTIILAFGRCPDFEGVVGFGCPGLQEFNLRCPKESGCPVSKGCSGRMLHHSVAV